ncbi:MAG: hypothetical protein EAZ57_05195 [Cytophagales bacterium]|nr:MAG: hypothetical protein EAZ67_06385 [Cytophagales bacterium]TAF60946.1 MAG: hypothetical protein EAZ57_05195 [Cytophagales bacterium]
MTLEKKDLKALEDLLAKHGYGVRYEKGTFKAGACMIKGLKQIVVNKHFNTEGKAICLLEMLLQMELNPELVSSEQYQLLEKYSSKKP